MNKIYIVIQYFIIFFVYSEAYSFSSSSYLIANSAMSLFDYERAIIHYNSDEISELNINDLEKKLLAYVNTNSMSAALIVAKKIIKIDRTNQEAWLVYLTNAKIKNIDKPFVEFNKLYKEEKEKLEIVNFIFYNDYKVKSDQSIIANSFFDVVQSSTSNIDKEYQNYDYFLFYLSLSLNLKKNFDEVLFFKAKLHQIIKNYEIAEKFYKRIDKKHNLYLESQTNIAINKSYLNNEKGAEESLIALTKSFPNNENTFISLANFYKSKKQCRKAIPHYSKVLNNFILTNDQKWRILFMRGICYEKINNWESAESDLLASININNNSPQVLNYLAYSWIERNMFIDKSLKMLEIAYDKNPENYYILDSLAWAHYKKNNYQIAAHLMEEVTMNVPDEAISLDHLGDIYFSMGRKREAVFMWQQAKDLAKPEDEIIEKIKKKLLINNAG